MHPPVGQSSTALSAQMQEFGLGAESLLCGEGFPADLLGGELLQQLDVGTRAHWKGSCSLPSQQGLSSDPAVLSSTATFPIWISASNTASPAE